MNKFIIFINAAVTAALLTGCATYTPYPAPTQVRQPTQDPKHAAAAVMMFSSLLPQAITESARTVDTSQGAQSLMSRMDMLGMQVQRKAGPCIEELNANREYLPGCYDYLVNVAAMMAVAQAAKPLMEREVRRNPRSQVSVTGDFSRAGEMIEPVGQALRAYYARNF